MSKIKEIDGTHFSNVFIYLNDGQILTFNKKQNTNLCSLGRVQRYGNYKFTFEYTSHIWDIRDYLKYKKWSAK